jgi:hypothetical protein
MKGLLLISLLLSLIIADFMLTYVTATKRDDHDGGSQIDSGIEWYAENDDEIFNLKSSMS